MSLYSKAIVLNMIRDRKDILFGEANHPSIVLERNAIWMEIHEKALSLGLISTAKTWEYTRDILWPNWKRQALAKCSPKSKYGSKVKAGKELTDTDMLVLDILKTCQSPTSPDFQAPKFMDYLSDIEFDQPTPSPSPKNLDGALAAESSLGNVVRDKDRSVKRTNPAVNQATKTVQTAGKVQSVNSVELLQMHNVVSSSSMESASVDLAANFALPKRNFGQEMAKESPKSELEVSVLEIDKRIKAIQLYELEMAHGLQPSEHTVEFHHNNSDSGLY